MTRVQRGTSDAGALLAALIVAGCMGAIGEERSDGRTDPVTGSGVGGSKAGPTAAGPTASIPLPPSAAGCSDPVGAARVMVRRLNRLEYNNTVRDLLGDTSRPAQELPEDDVDTASGFDNSASVLTVNSQLLGAMQKVAERLGQNAAQSPKIMTCSPSAALSEADCAKQILGPLARRAWRRTVTADELNDLVATVRFATSQGDTFAAGVGLAIRRMLLSYKFIFRLELLSAPTSTKPQALDGFAVASRLSYFLWRSMPDDTLLAAAEAGKLGDPKELDAQVTRMLADEKAGAMVQDLSRQWLLGAAALAAMPDATLYKSYDGALKAALPKETELFLSEFVGKNLNFVDLIDTDFTFLNDRLARHYGVAGVTGASFQKVSLAGNTQRGGLLTQGSIHLGTASNTTTTSIERRGVWVLRRLLCTEPPEPPGDAGDRQQMISAKLTNPTRRQVSEARNAVAECGACHKTFDPIGYALENYDLIGAWRTSDRSVPIDARGDISGVGAFNGPKELSAALKKDDRLKTCLAQTLATYALGRVFHDVDSCAVASMVAQAGAKGNGAREFIRAVVQSAPFRFQSGEAN